MKKAFTLAEVLITLMIIGIVAALTIPSVISNAQQQEFKTGLKKAVSVLNEAIQTNIAVEGETPYENSYLGAYLRRHMSYAFANSDNWWIKQINSPEARVGNNETFYTTDGMRYEIPLFYYDGQKPLRLHESGISLGSSYQRDGYTVYSTLTGSCGSYGLSNNPNNTKNTPCVVVVDVNGDKKPNPILIDNNSGGSLKKDGSYVFVSPSDKKVNDIFTIMITDEKAIPFGVVAQRAMYSK